MAPFKPYSSLCDAPTNLKEAIDWVLRVTGKDGKKNEGECICGLAAAVTDLLQSVELEYNGYQGETKGKGATQQDVDKHLNELFSLVQGLGGTSVVRTYIDQLAQVLSALVGWSKIEHCGSGNCGGKKSDVNGNPHGGESCKYLQNVQENKPCEHCKCMKWDVPGPNDHSKGHHLGRGCQRCSDSGGCQCATGGGSQCAPGKECQCALAGKCCKCCCTSCSGKCKEKCSCTTEESIMLNKSTYREITIERYMSSYSNNNNSQNNGKINTWEKLGISSNRSKCAKILLGSVCLIWSGVTYMHWTGKYNSGSSYWNNHILDGSGLDDGTLSQWLQALGFPKDMLNNSGPQNRLDKVIWDGFMGKLFLGFTHPGSHASDGTTAKQPYDMNYAGFVHTAHRDSFNKEATVFPKNGSSQGNDQHKIGAIFKLYILSCAYFTGLQKKRTESTVTQSSTTNNPKTIREILYWLSALPYSQAYKRLLDHSKGVLIKVAPDVEDKKQLSFLQQGRSAPITVHQYNLFAHFQAVTQYCPLVLIGIQGGLHSTTKTTPAIHALYSNTECHFTYPTVSIQAYNQVVHYIRALFYQLYFLRKQCAVKVALGGKWRECRYGKDVVSKGVISWMCLGCDPMEHDRKSRVGMMEVGLKTVSSGKPGDLPGKLKDLLEKIGEVVVQLGNAQERLDTGKYDLDGVKNALKKVFSGVNGSGNNFKKVLQEVLGEVEKKVDKLKGDSGLKDDGQTLQALQKATEALKAAKDALEKQNGDGLDPYKNLVSAAVDGLQKVLDIFMNWLKDTSEGLDGHKEALFDATRKLISICNSPKCPTCDKHSTKCGKEPVSKYCDKCHQQYMDGKPSPLQAFLEDRLPGFSCDVVRNDDTDKDTVYPPAASHLHHTHATGQCCPLPMGFRNNFCKGSISDCTGQRLYGILYFFSNENMMQSCVYTLVRVTAELSATTPQVLGDVFGFFRGGVGNPLKGKNKQGRDNVQCQHRGDPSDKGEDKYFCGWCASGLRDVVKDIEWIPQTDKVPYRESVGTALINIKGDKDTDSSALKSSAGTTPSALSALTKDSQYISPLTGELYTAVSATFGGTYLSWVLYLSDALEGGLKSLSDAFQQIECRGCKGCDPNKCKKGSHGDKGSAQCNCSSIVSCTGVLPVLYRHGFSYGNPFNLEGYTQKDGKTDGQYDIENKKNPKHCHEFLGSLSAVIKNQQDTSQNQHPLTELLKQVGKLQYDIRLPWIFVLTLAWLVAVLYLAFGALWPLDWTHMRSHWLRGGEHQWQCMWYKLMTGRKGVDLMEYFDQCLLMILGMV